MPKEISAQKMWNSYFTSCYGGKPLHPIQYLQISQAFMAGVYSMLAANMEIAELEEDAAVAKLEEIRIEVDTFHVKRIKAMMEKQNEDRE